ncbi:hypothetical protein T06_14080 [Trichinella sp. T6]|nr:hypothetical protein T06_14080 [Trichinella sp. T6]
MERSVNDLSNQLMRRFENEKLISAMFLKKKKKGIKLAKKISEKYLFLQLLPAIELNENSR